MLSTNGTIYKSFPKSENFQVQVNLPAIEREAYQRITGKDLVDKVKENIARYNEEHILFVNFPAYKKNFDQLKHVGKYCKQENIVLRVNQIIPVAGIEKVDEKILEKACLDLLLSENLEINLMHRKRGDCNCIEYHTPEGIKEHPFAAHTI